MAVLRAKSPGDADTVINMTKIAARLRKTLVSSMNDTRIQLDLGMFELPKEDIFPEQNLTRDLTVNLQVRIICALHYKYENTNDINRI